MVWLPLCALALLALALASSPPLEGDLNAGLSPVSPTFSVPGGAGPVSAAGGNVDHIARVFPRPPVTPINLHYTVKQLAPGVLKLPAPGSGAVTDHIMACQSDVRSAVLATCAYAGNPDVHGCGRNVEAAWRNFLVTSSVPGLPMALQVCVQCGGHCTVFCCGGAFCVSVCMLVSIVVVVVCGGRGMHDIVLWVCMSRPCLFVGEPHCVPPPAV